MLKPKKALITLVYECPKCSCESDYSFKQAKHLKGMVCPYCDSYTKFEPLSRVSVVPHYGDEQPKHNIISSPAKAEKRDSEKQDKVSPRALTPVQEDAILALSSLGVKKTDAKKFVNDINFDTIEEYIREFGKVSRNR